MRKARDYIHHYTKRGCPGVEGYCRVRIYVPASANVEGAGRPVIVCSEPPIDSGYSGPSITNEAELVAAGILEHQEIADEVGAWRRSSSDAPVPFYFVEHYPRGEAERRSGLQQTFDLVTFASYEPAQRDIVGNSYRVLGEPEWTATTREFVEALTTDVFDPDSEAAFFGYSATDSARAQPAENEREEPRPTGTGSEMLQARPWDPQSGDVVLRRVPDFEAGLDLGDHLSHKIQINVPWSVVQHSPGGFEWSYAGSGPADLALNILNAFIPPNMDNQPQVRCFEGEASETASALHQRFKEAFLAGMPREGGTIPGEEIRAWIEARVVRGFPGGEIVGHVPDGSNR